MHSIALLVGLFTCQSHVEALTGVEALSQEFANGQTLKERKRRHRKHRLPRIVDGQEEDQHREFYISSLHKEIDEQDYDDLPSEKRFNFLDIPSTMSVEQLPANGEVDYLFRKPQYGRDVDMSDLSRCKRSRAPAQFLRLKKMDTLTEQYLARQTICVTRHPYERAVNLYMDMQSNVLNGQRSDVLEKDDMEAQNCSAEGMNSYLQAVLSKVLWGRKYIESCAFLPQSDYIWGDDGTQWCNTTLRHDTLPGSFNKLMSQQSSKDRWSTDLRDTTKTLCPALNASALTIATARLLNKVYADDFKKLGYSKRSKDLLFVTIPRNAGEAVRSAGQHMLAQIAKGFPTTLSKSSRPALGSCDRYLLPPRNMSADDKALVMKSESFCVVRHPYDRALSLYTDLLLSASGVDVAEENGMDLYERAPCSKLGLNSFLQQALKVYNQTGGSIPDKPGTFMLNCHMIPQAHYVVDEAGQPTCTNVLQQEHLSEAFAQITAEHGYRSLTLSSGELKNPRLSSDRCPHLSPEDIWPETRRSLQDAYAVDFDAFKFPV